MKKREKNTKRTPRLVAQTLVVSLLMGTAVPTSGLGRVVYASESDKLQTTQEVSEDAAQEALMETDKAKDKVVAEAAITVGQDIISSEALGIINAVQAEQNVEKAKNAVAEGEQKVDKALEGFDTQINNSKTDSEDAQKAADTAEDEADKTGDALEAAKGSQTSTAAKEQEAIAKDAADAAQKAADTAASEAQSAKDAYIEAENAYNEALKEAAAAEKEASEALNSAEKNAELAVQKAEAAKKKAEELKGEVEAAREKAEEHFTEKEAALSQAQQELGEAKESLEKAAAKEEVAREELKTATEAVVETGAFLVAAEAYETLAEVTVEGIELAITAMEEAKDLADKALVEAEEALNNAEGNEADAQKAYDAALAAYNTANATLEQANADLEVAKKEQEEADALAGSGYGQKLTKIEKELIEANEANKEELVAQKTQELIAYVIMYDQGSSEAKYESVELVDATNMIYEAKDAEGNASYYQYVKNTDGSFSFFECIKNETATTVKNREIVTELSSVEGKNEWEYDVVDLGNGSYEVTYYDVKDTVFTSQEEANHFIAEGGNKEIFSFEESTETTYDALKAPSDGADWKEWVNFTAANIDRNNELSARLDNGDKLTIVVNGTEKELFKDSLGLYYIDITNVLGADIPRHEYNISGYSVKAVETKTQYRVVEYNETIKTDYALVDNTADDSYVNVTDRVTAANEKYKTAEDNIKDAATNKKSAEEEEKAKASALAAAEEELANVQKVHDTVAEMYDSYYGNEEVEFEIPEEAVKVINMLGITDTSTIISLVEKTGIFDTLGIDTSEVYIDITEDGQVTIEIPGTSKYAQHMVALEVAKLAAEENLEQARKVVAEKRADHEAAVDNLEVKAAEYGEAVKELASAAIEVGKAEIQVGKANVELTAAEAAFEALKVAEAYAEELVLKAQEARARVAEAEALVETLKNDITVRSEELAAAEAALETAKAELEKAELAAENAQREADAAKANYVAIQVIVTELEKSETPDEPVNPGTSHNSGSLSNSSNGASTQTVSAPQGMVTIDDEVVPLAQTFTLDGITYIDVTPELIDDKLMENVLHKYYGQNVYLLAHMGNGIGFTIDAENIMYGAGNLDLSGYMELVENFEPGFTTMRFVPYHPTKLSYEIGVHMHVGEEFAGKKAYLFTKNLETGLYEFQKTAEVSENGNVMVNSKSLTRTIAMIQE